MINTPKRGKLGSSGRVEVSERKHLTSREYYTNLPSPSTLDVGLRINPDPFQGDSE